jgi:diguanylate cyclase (GGDEF)-like protein
VGIGAVVLWALNSLGPGNEWVGVTEDAVSTSALALLWVGLWRRRDWAGRPWVFVAAGLTCWVVGDLVWDGYALAGFVRPDVSLADAFYLAGYPLLALGLYGMARARAGLYLREGLLDGSIFGVAAAIAAWQLLVVPTVAGTHSALTAAVWSAYPLGDVLLIAAAAWLVFTPGRRRIPTMLLLGALCVTFVADVLYSYLPLVSSYNVTQLDWLYPLTYLMIAGAALHPDSTELTTAGPETSHLHPARLVILGASLCAVPAVAITTDTAALTTRIVLLGLSLLLSLAVIVRFALAVRARESAQRALRYQATHDELTGVVNRVLLMDRIGHALERSRHREPLAVMYLDLDRFKPINDTLGHEVGDQLLTEIARRIASTLRPSDTLGRFGGDEFVVVCEATTPELAIGVANRIVEAVSAPLELAALTIQVTSSIGVATSEESAAVDDLIRNADEAMYAAKRRGGNCVEFYDDELREHYRQRRDIEEALKDAIARGELFLHYQPIVRTADGSVAGFEALLRWQRPDGTMIPPSDFIPIAEEIGLINPIGDWVIHQACQQLRAWTLDGIDGPWISVNVSPLQLRHEAARRSLADALAQTGANPNRLVIELTESALVSDENAGTSQLDQIRKLGVRVAIDDFGTGYSGLAYLRTLPVDSIKIDQAFIAEIVTDSAASAVLAAIVHLAHILEFEVIAEGAETVAQVELLRSLDCDYIQGFYYARPVAAAAATAIARAGLIVAAQPVSAAHILRR